MRILILVLFVASVALAGKARIYVELHENGDLVGTAQIGTLPWRSTVIYDLSRSDIVLRGEIVNISRTWNPVASHEHLALGSAQAIYLPVSDGSADDYDQMKRRGADAIVGLAFGTPLGWHWSCISLSATTITVDTQPCSAVPMAACTYSDGGTCIVEGTRLFAPGGTFYATKDVVENAIWSWSDIRIGPFVVGGHSYQKTGVEKAVQYLAIGDPALSSLALRTVRFDLHLDRGAVSWRSVRANVILPPAGHVISVILLVAWAVYCASETGTDPDARGLVALFEGPPSQHGAAVVIGALSVSSVVLTSDILSDILEDGQGVLPVVCMMHAVLGLAGAVLMTRSVFTDYVVETAAWASIVLLALYETEGAWAMMRYSIPVAGFVAVYIRCLIRYARAYLSWNDTATVVPLVALALVAVLHVTTASVFCFAPLLDYHQSFDSGTMGAVLSLAVVALSLAVYSHSNT